MGFHITTRDGDELKPEPAQNYTGANGTDTLYSRSTVYNTFQSVMQQLFIVDPKKSGPLSSDSGPHTRRKRLF